VTRVRYCDNFNLACTAAGSIGKQYMRLNSLYDPDQTGTGHQTYWNTQFAQIYNRYVVLGSKMTVQFGCIVDAIATAQPSGPITIGVSGDDSASTTTTATTLLEQNSSKSDMISGGAGGSIKTMTLTYSPMRDLGLPPSDDTVGAAMGSNPSKQWYGLAYAINSGLATTSTVVAKIEVEYLVRFSQVKDVTGS